MGDAEMLYFAAKALGCDLFIDDSGAISLYKDGEFLRHWNPKFDDGDSLRLAADLDIDISFGAPAELVVGAETFGHFFVVATPKRLEWENRGFRFSKLHGYCWSAIEPYIDSREEKPEETLSCDKTPTDKMAACRLAVLRAAAEIGKAGAK